MTRAALPDKLGRAKGVKVMVTFNAETGGEIIGIVLEERETASMNRTKAV
jgi:hypothetical protein